jgi:hypothetical protein
MSPSVTGGPQTGTGTPPGNVNGQAIAITVFSTVKRWGVPWLRALVFNEPKLLPQTLLWLQKLSFIHFARWTMVTDLPYNGAPQPRQKLRHPHLYFESNFNGGWEEYIDAFSYVLGPGMTAFWGSSYGFPGPVPTAPFKQYIQTSDLTLVASHFYAAYPDSTVTMINQSLELDGYIDELRGKVDDLSPDDFADAFDALLAKGQRCF